MEVGSVRRNLRAVGGRGGGGGGVGVGGVCGLEQMPMHAEQQGTAPANSCPKHRVSNSARSTIKSL